MTNASKTTTYDNSPNDMMERLFAVAEVVMQSRPYEALTSHKRQQRTKTQKS